MKLLTALAAMLVLSLPAVADEAKPVDTAPKLAYGQMIKYGDKLVFSPCRDRSMVFVEDISDGRTVTRALGEVGLDAGKKLYVELMAVIEGGALKASGLNLARTEGRCQQPGGADEAWRAGGNEPSWALAAGGDTVLLKRLGKPDVKAPYAPFRNEGGASIFEAPAARLTVRLVPGTCRDTMADAVSGWTATVTVDGQTLKGCAWQR